MAVQAPTWSYDSGIGGTPSTPADGLDSAPTNNTYTNTKGSVENYGDSSFGEETEESDEPTVESSTTSSSDTDANSSYDYELGSFYNQSPTDFRAEQTSGKLTVIETESDTSLQNCSDNDDDINGITTNTLAENSSDNGSYTLSQWDPGSDTFSGLGSGDGAYGGDGTFYETYFETGSFTDSDSSTYTLDPTPTERERPDDQRQRRCLDEN